MNKISRIREELNRGRLKGLLRLLILKEYKKRNHYINRIRNWYHKQLFIVQCTHIGKNLTYVGSEPITIFVGENGRFILGNDVSVKSTCKFSIVTHIYNDAMIKIGDRVRFGSFSSVRAAKEIIIGEDCMIAPHVRIFDYNSHPLAPYSQKNLSKIKRNAMETPKTEVRAVRIEPNVWIGEHAFILAGVTIGENSIIGANSVVTKNIPENVIALGNPARVVMWLKDLYYIL